MRTTYNRRYHESENIEGAFEDLAAKSDRSFSKETVRAMREYAERQGIKCPE